MLPYGRQSISEEDIAAVVDVLRGDWLTTGPAVARFERRIAETAGVDTPAVAVTSGTAALHVAYAAAGVGPGDQVITTPLTFLATATTAAILGAEVVFADVCEDTGNIDPRSVEAAITDRTVVVAGVDYAGHPIDAPALRELTAFPGISLLEDAAHSIGGSLHGISVGSLADITTFSFFPTKNLTTAEGGAIVSPNTALIERARTFKGIGMVRDSAAFRIRDEGPWWYEMPELGLNYRLPDVLCALGIQQLTRLYEFKKRRQDIVDLYNAAFTDVAELRTPAQRDGANPAWHLYPLRVLDGRRLELFNHLRNSGIGVQVNYIPVYWHPWFTDHGYKRGLCPIAEEYYSQQISLPLFPGLTESDIDRVCTLVRDFFSH